MTEVQLGPTVNTVAFKKLATLNDGRTGEIKLLTREDRNIVLNLFAEASPRDCRFLKRDVKNREMVARWMDNLDHRFVMPMGAIDVETGELMGYALVVCGHFAARHRAEVEVFVASGYRNLGLGSILLREATIISQQRGIQLLRAEVPVDMKQVIKGFRRLGFELKCHLENYYMDQDDQTYDVALLVRYLITETADEFFYTF